MRILKETIHRALVEQDRIGVPRWKDTEKYEELRKSAWSLLEEWG